MAKPERDTDVTAVRRILLPVGQRAAALLPEQRQRGEVLGGADGPAQAEQREHPREHQRRRGPLGRGHVALRA